MTSMDGVDQASLQFRLFFQVGQARAACPSICLLTAVETTQLPAQLTARVVDFDLVNSGGCCLGKRNTDVGAGNREGRYH
jgi:hypothetical protein